MKIMSTLRSQAVRVVLLRRTLSSVFRCRWRQRRWHSKIARRFRLNGLALLNLWSLPQLQSANTLEVHLVVHLGVHLILGHGAHRATKLHAIGSCHHVLIAARIFADPDPERPARIELRHLGDVLHANQHRLGEPEEHARVVLAVNARVRCLSHLTATSWLEPVLRPGRVAHQVLEDWRIRSELDVPHLLCRQSQDAYLPRQRLDLPLDRSDRRRGTNRRSLDHRLGRRTLSRHGSRNCLDAWLGVSPKSQPCCQACLHQEATHGGDGVHVASSLGACSTCKAVSARLRSGSQDWLCHRLLARPQEPIVHLHDRGLIR